MGLTDSILEDCPKLKPFLFWFGLIVMVSGGLFIYSNKCVETYVFTPFSGTVKSAYTETSKRAGVYYQRIVLKNKEWLTANGFLTEIDGEKVRLIDFIQLNDSIVCNSEDTLYVYRGGCKTYKFIFNSDFFK